MSRIKQEFYCGECKGYFLANLSATLTMHVDVVCPECGHKHRRFIENGIIKENGRDTGNTPKEELIGLKATYSKRPLTAKMRETREQNGAYHSERRNGVPLTPEEQFAEAYRADAMDERWVEKASNEKEGYL